MRERESGGVLRQSGIATLVVFRALQLGDMLCAVPALRALRAAVPHARVTLAGLPWAAQFARRFDNYIDDFVAFPGHPAFPEQAVQEQSIAPFYQAMRARRFDLALQLHGSGRISNRIIGDFGARLQAGHFAPDEAPASAAPLFTAYPDEGPEPLRLLHLVQFLGAPAAGHALEFPITTEDARELHASGLAAGLVPGRYACIHPGARRRDKCWPPRLFAQVADQLAQEFGLAIVLTGSAEEIDLATEVASCMRCKSINAAAPISIGAMAALMRGARLMVCNDTGVSHIAAGLRLPSVVVFGSTDMGRWAPLDRELHRCVRDPEGHDAAQVLRQARELLA